MSEHLYPIFDTILKKEDKEKILNQHALVIWFVGLSGSGKSTIARALENKLHSEGYLTQLLDGDNLRTGLNKNLGFTEEERIENIRRTAETAKLFKNCGVITLCSYITPTESIRAMARDIIGQDYFQVFVKCPIEVCEERDVKGIYAKARKGEIKNFTGIDAPFEEPLNSDLILDTDRNDLVTCLEILYKKIVEKIKYQEKKL